MNFSSEHENFVKKYCRNRLVKEGALLQYRGYNLQQFLLIFLKQNTQLWLCAITLPLFHAIRVNQCNKQAVVLKPCL